MKQNSPSSKNTALMITDVQHDFLPGGALGIEGADRIVPIINALIPRFEWVFATLDWHPPKHISFASAQGRKPGDKIRIGNVEQILWPDHCVQNTWGAEPAEGLHRERIAAVFHKGVDPHVDSYSTFFDSSRKRSTGLADRLRKEGIEKLYFAGLATEYCILYSVLDALELGFQVAVIQDACRAIDLHPGDGERALEKMSAKGAEIVFSSALL